MFGFNFRQGQDVGGNLVARLHIDDVAGHDVISLDDKSFPAANDGGAQRKHVADGLHGLFRLALLDETDDGVDDNDRHDDGRVHPMRHERRHDRGDDEHVDEHVVELQSEAQQRASPLAARQAIGAMDSETPLSLRLAQARARGLKSLQNRLEGDRRPAFLGRWQVRHVGYFPLRRRSALQALPSAAILPAPKARDSRVGNVRILWGGFALLGAARPRAAPAPIAMKSENVVGDARAGVGLAGFA